MTRSGTGVRDPNRTPRHPAVHTYRVHLMPIIRVLVAQIRGLRQLASGQQGPHSISIQESGSCIRYRKHVVFSARDFVLDFIESAYGQD